MQLQGKSVIITGASSGIGKAAAQLFASEGAALVLGARRADLIEQVAQEITGKGGKAVTLKGDVTDESYCEALVELAKSEYGKLDAAFNNAGIMGDIIPIPEITQAQWKKVLDTNLSSAFYSAKYQIPAMTASKGGSIIFTSTFVGHTASMPGVGAYAASKAGLIGLAQVIAVEHGMNNIRANTLLPGGTLTAMSEAMAGTPEGKEFVSNLHALKRMAEPLEIARAALFLASDNASFVTGSAMIVDGGNSVNKV